MGCSAAGILVGVPVILAWARPRPFIVPLSIAVSVLVSVPPIWSNVLFANEYGWDIGGKHGATSLGFGVLLTVACLCMRRVRSEPASAVAEGRSRRLARGVIGYTARSCATAERIRHGHDDGRSSSAGGEDL
jgi:hypothetical protein